MSKMNNKNLAPKIISILFALVLWIYVMGTINPKAYKNFTNIPVKLINIVDLKEQNLAIKNNDDFKVRVKVTGRRDEINKILAEQIQVRADLRGYGIGTNNIPLEAIVPNNVEVDVIPRFITIELEKIITSQKPVKIKTSGAPKENFVVGNLQYKPSTVEIEGPESYVNSVQNIVAELDISSVSSNFAKNLLLKPVNNKGEEVPNIKLKTSHASVSLLIDSLKTVPIKPNLQITTDDSYVINNVEINPKEVTLKGQKELLNDINEIMTEQIKIDNLNENKRVDTKLDLPEGVTLHNNVPITIDIHLKKTEEATYKISKDKIVFKNIDEELEIDISDIDENIDVKVVAQKDVLDSIEENDIKIVVDLNGLDANEYTIEPIVELPYIIQKEVKKLYLNPKTINIKLVEK